MLFLNMLFFGFYSPIFILQAYCIYHAYKNRIDIKWFYLIFFLPLIGSLIYLYEHVYSKSKVVSVAEGIKGIVNPEYQVDQLLKEAKYADTVTNKTKLADAYFDKDRYHAAIPLYESCLSGFNKDDLGIKEKLIKAYYRVDDYEAAIEHGSDLESNPAFAKSESRVVYAWSLFMLGNVKEAKSHFSSFDLQFENYEHRLEYAKFLMQNREERSAKELLERMQDEIEHMESAERKAKRSYSRRINIMLKDLV